MSRRSILFLSLPLLLLLLAGGLVLFRLEAATALLKQQLVARGVDHPQLQVTALDLDGATIETIRLGDKDELRIGRLAVAYSWRELGSGQLRDIAIEDAAVKLDLTGENPPLGSLQTLIETLAPDDQKDEGSAGDSAATGPSLPPIRFTGGRIEALTPEGPLSLDTSGVLTLGENDRMSVTARIEGKGPPGQAVGEIEAELLDGKPVRMLAELTLTDFALPLVTAQNAALKLDLSEQALAIDLDLHTLEGTALLSLFMQSAQPLAEFLALVTAENPYDALSDSNLSGQGALTLVEFDLPGILRGASADLVFDLTLEDAVLSLDLPAPAEFTAKPTPTALRQAGLPDGMLPAFAQPLQLRLTQRVPEASALSLRREDGGFSLHSNLGLSLDYGFGSALRGELNGDAAFTPTGGLRSAQFPAARLQAERLVLAGVQLAQGTYEGGLRYTQESGFRAEGMLQLTELAARGHSLTQGRYQGSLAYNGGALQAQGHLMAEAEALQAGGTAFEDLTLDFPVALQGTPEQLVLSWDRPVRLTAGAFDSLPLEMPAEGLTLTSERGSLVLDLRAGLAFSHDFALSLDLPPSDLGGLRLRSSPVSLQLSGGSNDDGDYTLQASGETASIELPDYEIRASAITLEGQIDAEKSDFTLRIAALSDQREPQILPPLSVVIAGKPSERGLALAISATGSGNRLKANAMVSIDTDKGSGAASFTLAPLLFVPGSLQPVDIAPLLGGLTEVQAELRTEGKLAWNRGGLTRSSADIRLNNASMTTGAGRVEGLTTALALSSLWPPLSDAPQELTAASYETNNIEFTDLSARYRVVEGPGDFPESLPLLLIEHAQLRFGRGLFEVSDVLIDPLSDRQSATVDVEGLELKDLFNLADLNDVTGEGLLSGSVPFSISNGNVVIQDGLLESTGPGVFNIRSAEAKAALSGAGDYVDLVLQALENFQYERLSIAVNKPEDGNSVLQLKVLGSNPEVLDGHPFDINLNLETDLGPLLQALTAGQRLSKELMEQIRQQQNRQNESRE